MSAFSKMWSVVYTGPFQVAHFRFVLLKFHGLSISGLTFSAPPFIYLVNGQ